MSIIHPPLCFSALKVYRVHVKTNKHQLLPVDVLHNKAILFSQGHPGHNSVSAEIVRFSFASKLEMILVLIEEINGKHIIDNFYNDNK